MVTAGLTAFSVDDKLAMLEVATEVTVDTEVDPLHGISVAFDGPAQGFYFPIAHAGNSNINGNQRGKLYSLLASRDFLVFHNAVYDLRILAEAGLDYRGEFYDTMLMAHWINEERYNYSLDTISKLYGGKPKEMPEFMKAIIENDGWDAVPASLMDEYSAHDAFITHHLFRKLQPQFEEQNFAGDLWKTEQKFIRDVMYPMMQLGIKADTSFSIREYMRGMAIMEECKKELGFNPGSTKQLEKFLIDDLGLPVLARTPKGKPSFTKNEMEVYEVMLEHKKDKRASTILRYRGWQKATSSSYRPYIDLSGDDGVLHPGYKLHGTRTGRLSCEKPNLQQIPKSSDKDWNGNLKNAFVARPGFGLHTVDYSQLQFRMTVAYAHADTDCSDLLDVFNDPTRDIFTEMAKQMGWLRHNVKTLVYLILFGGGATRAKFAFNLDTVEEGMVLVKEFHGLYPSIAKVAKKAENAARKQGHVTYWTGRRRHFPRGSAFYRAFNAVIQGGEAEIIKRAMIALVEEVCDENCRILLQIHDEVVFEIREGMEDEYLDKAQKVMENAPKAFCDFVGVDIAFKTSRGKWGEK